MSEISKIVLKGRIGILVFLSILILKVIIALFKLYGNILIFNIILHGVPAIILLFCVVFLVEHPIRLLSVSLVICTVEILWIAYVNLFKIIQTGGIDNIIYSLIAGGLRLIALWAIWSALSEMKNIVEAK
jgi:hypothetical protein